MSKETMTPEAAPRPRPRKANECVIDPKEFHLPIPLFDEFWREGELALFFGEHGSGKSLLAVQIADGLARAKNLDGFRMPKGRRRVLYVDLDLRDTQFTARCSYFPPNSMAAKSHKFAENLYYDRPPAKDDLCEWLRAMVQENGIQVVIIDSLAATKRTHDGTRETLSLMRKLREIRDELRVSILVLTDAEPPGRSGMLSEYDLRRSRVLCGIADSVFAIGLHPHSKGYRYLIQTRSTAGPVFWTAQNAPAARVTRMDTGLLAFQFDERFAPRMDEEMRLLICQVRSMREQGTTYRDIARNLGISKTRAATLYKKWTPALECGLRNADCGIRNSEGGAAINPQSEALEEWDEAGFEKPAWLDGEGEICAARENRVEEYDAMLDDPRFDEMFDDEDDPALIEEYRKIDAARAHARKEYLKTGVAPPLNLSEPPASAGGSVQKPARSKGTEAADELVIETEGDGTTNPHETTRSETRETDNPLDRMKVVIDAYGKDRFIEEEYGNGQAKVWYIYTDQGHLMRYDHSLVGHIRTSADPAVFGKYAKIDPPPRT